MIDYLLVLKDFGPYIGVILFFIWGDWKREEGLVDRVRSLEKFNTEVLVSLVKEATAVIAANTEQLRLITLITKIKAHQNG
jgi:hypothetical protein